MDLALRMPRSHPVWALAPLLAAVVLLLLLPPLPSAARVVSLWLVIPVSCLSAALALDRSSSRARMLVAAVGGVWLACWLVAGFPRVTTPTFLLAWGVAMLVPIIVGWRWVLRRLQRARTVETFRRMTTPVTGEIVLRALSTALADPTVDLFVRDVDGDRWLTMDGVRLAGPPKATCRASYELRWESGEVIAVLTLAEPVSVSSYRIRDVTETCTSAVETVRLQAALRAQLEDLRNSRADLVHAAIGERKRLGRDLHDGAQQHLLVIAARLGQIGMGRETSVLDNDPLGEEVRSARADLRAALSALRNLSRDVYPLALETDGFAAGLESLADQFGVDVIQRVPDRLDCPDDVELVAYWTVHDIILSLPDDIDAIVVEASVQKRTLLLSVDTSPAVTQTPVTANSLWQLTADRVSALGGVFAVRSEAARSRLMRPGELTCTWIQVSLPFE